MKNTDLFALDVNFKNSFNSQCDWKQMFFASYIKTL